MKTFAAYVRVSTQRQSDTGTSLTEQRRSIEAYADRHQLVISEWLEETETAAKRGRPVFDRLLIQLAQSPTAGLLIHKIDRSARNLRDWAALGELIDQGIDVRFTHEDISLDTRGGRLAADLQAVIAADYIRNLRQEVLKGLSGRLRQGLYPFGAPIGYRNCGGGRAKMPDPVIAPLVIAAFDRFATGSYALGSLAMELSVLGLRTKTDRPLTPTSMSRLLRNSFYVGELEVSGVRYAGVHQPLVERDLFDRVQDVLAGRRPGRNYHHEFAYRRRLRCVPCGGHLTGERQKGRVYYRCHSCPRIAVREDRVVAVSRNLIRLESAVPPLICYGSSKSLRVSNQHPAEANAKRAGMA